MLNVLRNFDLRAIKIALLATEKIKSFLIIAKAKPGAAVKRIFFFFRFRTKPSEICIFMNIIFLPRRSVHVLHRESGHK